jgi:hypothetical protein
MKRVLDILAVLVMGTHVPSQALSQDWVDAFRIPVASCWNISALDEAARAVSATLAFELDETGVPKADTIALVRAEGGTEAAREDAFTAASRAIIRCGHEGYDLPRDQYDQWRNVELTFNPEDMRIK